MRYTIDRIENDIAVLEPYDGTDTQNVSLNIMYDGVREGDIVMCDNGKYVFLAKETEAQKANIKARFTRLSRRKCGEKG